MKRKEFLRNLDERLRVLDFDVKQDIINEFDVHIRQGVETGLSEEEVIRSLGSFEDIVAELLEQEEVKTKYSPVEEEPVKEEIPKVIVEREKKTKHSPTDFDPKKIKKLYIEAEAATVTVVKGESFSMDYQSPKADSTVDYEVEGDMLKINQRNDKDRWLIWSFKKIKSNNKLVITWPYDLDFLEIEVDFGAVRVEGLKANDIHIEGNMGSVTGQKLNGKHFTLKSDMGRVNIEHSKAQTMTLASDMGTVHLEECYAKVYDVKSDMGRITGNNINPDADGLFITDMGAIKVTFKEEPTDTEIITRTDMGHASSPYKENRNATYRLTFETDMGSVIVK